MAAPRVPPAVDAGLGTAQVVAVQKTTGKVEKMIVLKPNLSGQQIRHMYNIHFLGAAQMAGQRHLLLAVDAVAGNHYCPHMF